MWVKICGNTNLEDAAHAAEAGADAVGFVFAASKRQVTAAQVASITRHLPATVERVGVFDTHDAKEIVTIAAEAGLSAVQLHGGFDEILLRELAPALADSGVNIVQTLHWVTSPISPRGVGERFAPSSTNEVFIQLARIVALGVVNRVLIDSKVGAASGGMGIAYDWSAAQAVFAAVPSGLGLIVAGGLNPGNVTAAIGELRPWGVDVSSGVEKSPGRKDPVLVAAFVKNARG
jgi:phosphoribosylanthranilate isomerase